MREYFFIATLAAACTFVITPLIRRLAVRVGAVTAVRARDVHSQPIPRLGGLGICLGFLAAVLVARQLPHLSQIFDSTEILGICAGGVLAAAVGAIDDIVELDALTKLAGQAIAAGVMAWFGVQLLSIPLFGVTVLPSPVLIGLTVFIALVAMNAVNFIDGLDGLAAGIVAIAAFAFFIYAYQLSYTYDPPNVISTGTFVCAAISGSCIGFLPHNFHQAKLFMGDSGALFLGLMLSAAMISMIGNIDPTAHVTQNDEIVLYLPLIVPVAVLGIPLLDMFMAVVRRVRRGQSPFQADAQHLQHRMLRIGHSHRHAVLLLYLWAAIVAFGVVSFSFVDGLMPLAGIMLLAAVALVLTLNVGDRMRMRRSRLRLSKTREAE
ncbi:MraY family glycosyltransferase [Dermatophilus congolensis]|uniref:MraY family glycosyltransferase n=1 Tax=Dermatophilus congolensis TaxID=1863 RepID=UPI001AAE96F6|nr:undecaprenyl/decaprenyl-phosphate alpha-N-acetylglucosaminyl 1-phosphate transferase [Dermatophilus congolensis]MBO3151119.1 undecaprenyl/decaprenyl-phosphate alpha-N-acetylglucosaminyl 1-phosphate transferase [Dermatophilus congolensis]MBO3161879.1 undecaprenyl/decaprenyl-phosphate alpha-N-acetylglucosaminyl 1-phosphate transferase [Dermatophilus congolensis]MBO3162402.1 undecaprenyl/decaprenyl-phosphate alpha-N-acetylglucosaminyl 1-phosphate transferase [Dermatophilus congolensis]MBO317596